MARKKKRLGDLLILAGKISQTQLEEAIAAQKESGQRLGSTLVGLGYVSEQELNRFLASQQGVLGFEEKDIAMDEALVKLLPEDFVPRFVVVPVSANADTSELVVATATPNNLVMLDEIRFMTRYRRVTPMVASESQIRRCIESNWSTHALLEEVIHNGGLFDKAMANQYKPEAPDNEELYQLQVDAEKQPIVALVNYLLIEAVRRKASDIHIEPYEEFLRVRMRIDGILHAVLTPPPSLLRPLVSRIKIISGMDISVSRRPQDGHIALEWHEETLHYRVNALPTVYGEKVVVRLLKKEADLLDLTSLGFPPAVLTRLSKTIAKPQGLFLVTGPTGSGKTTTLHAALAHVTSIEKNAVSLEDPFEAEVPGVNHVQVDKKSGLTFIEGLRAILRQDPDIVFLGEIRDLEVAKTAMEAAMTGHMVFSTLHTNSAIESLVRMEDMGVDTFLVAGTLQAVLAQRLVRAICKQCRVQIEAPTAHLLEAGVEASDIEGRTFYAGEGCNHCMGSGYKGRRGVYELLTVTPRIRSMIRKKADIEEIEAAAAEEGMQTLWEHGLVRVLNGETTMDEVRRTLMQD